MRNASDQGRVVAGEGEDGTKTGWINVLIVEVFVDGEKERLARLCFFRRLFFLVLARKISVVFLLIYGATESGARSGKLGVGRY